MIQNSRGKRFYGLHFYSGLAEYQEPGKDPYRVFLNEDTLRSMDPSFEGCPVFLEHVDGVDDNIDELRKEADGWVNRSFYNETDGKHWVEFFVCSERGLKAIARGMRLSNCYEPKTTAKGGVWNGIPYQREITSGEYEHLAIVSNPRYDESVILTPDEFKLYNETKALELKRLSNDKEGTDMALKFFKRKVEKIENGADLEATMVTLPKSGKELTLAQICNSMDQSFLKGKDAPMANGDHMIDYDGEKLTVNAMMEKHSAMCQELADLKAKHNDDDTTEDFKPADQPIPVSATNEDDKKDSDKDDTKANDDDDDKPKPKKDQAKNELDKARPIKDAKKAADKIAADKLRNAERVANDLARKETVEIGTDKVARGKARYGS